LLISTGDGDAGNLLKSTEVLNLYSKDAQVPTYQNHTISMGGAKGGFVANQFITCGGYNDGGYGVLKECYKIGATSTSLHGTMKEKRESAASIVLTDKIWILGGRDDNFYNFKSTEYILHDGSQEDGPDLPISLNNHAAIQINDTHFILVGGNVAVVTPQIKPGLFKWNDEALNVKK
jgi:NAD-specific glutamate dehydrogenase